MHGFQTEKLALLTAIWLVAFASAVARSLADAAVSSRRGNRLAVRDHVAISASSGFASVCLLGLVLMAVSADFVTANREYLLAAAAGIGMLGKEQHGLVRNLLYAFLKVKPPEDDKADK